MGHSPDFNRKIADALEAAYEKAKHTPSNADRIRAMSDEELAVLLEGCICPSEPCKKVVNRERQPDKKMCQSCWLDWLKREVDSGTT